MDLQLELVFGPFYLYLAIYLSVILAIIFGVMFFKRKNKKAEKKGWEEGKREAERLKRMELRKLANRQNKFTIKNEEEDSGRNIINIRGRYDDEDSSKKG